jgi:hypothetical protein
VSRFRPAALAGLLALGGLLLAAAPAGPAAAARAVPARTVVSPAASPATSPAVLSHTVFTPAGIRPAGMSPAGMSPALSGDDATLTASSCTSTTFCAAGGFWAEQGGQIWPAMAQTWNGTGWTGTANLGGFSYRGIVSFPLELSCGTPTACMMVGEHYTNIARPAMMAYVWTGTEWDQLRWYNPAGMASASLDDVSCIGADYCMLVGAQAKKTADHNYAAQWTGSGGLKPVKIPGPAHARASVLGAVSCTSATHCVAIGVYWNSANRALAFGDKWNGTSWKLMKVPSIAHKKQTIFESVSCPGPATCVAAGYTETYGKHPVTRPLVETYRGGKWRWSGTPRRSNAGFTAVSCTSLTRCMAAGWSGQAALAETWNGTSWRVLKTARTASPKSGDGFNHVSCASSSYCIAVGYRYNPRVIHSNHTLAEVWNGKSWTVQTTINP